MVSAFHGFMGFKSMVSLSYGLVATWSRDHMVSWCCGLWPLIYMDGVLGKVLRIVSAMLRSTFRVCGS